MAKNTIQIIQITRNFQIKKWIIWHNWYFVLRCNLGKSTDAFSLNFQIIRCFFFLLQTADLFHMAQFVLYFSAVENWVTHFHSDSVDTGNSLETLIWILQSFVKFNLRFKWLDLFLFHAKRFNYFVREFYCYIAYGYNYVKIGETIWSHLHNPLHNCNHMNAILRTHYTARKCMSYDKSKK